MGLCDILAVYMTVPQLEKNKISPFMRNSQLAVVLDNEGKKWWSIVLKPITQHHLQTFLTHTSNVPYAFIHKYIKQPRRRSPPSQPSFQPFTKHSFLTDGLFSSYATPTMFSKQPSVPYLCKNLDCKLLPSTITQMHLRNFNFKNNYNLLSCLLKSCLFSL